MREQMPPSLMTQSLDYQLAILPGVSRTFALTIPQLPKALRTAITNAYLLCRIADTIEDDVNLSADEIAQFQGEFIRVLKAEGNLPRLVSELSPRLSPTTLAAERELITNMDKVVNVTRQFNPSKREVLIRCVEVMCDHMPGFQYLDKKQGLGSLKDMNHYCYAVAGVVGEMLTELFCNYSDEIALHSDELMRLAPSFGQGLQMTNILKDIWSDLESGTCWLPADVFSEAGYDLKKLSPDFNRERFAAAMEKLIAITHGHLKNALAYSLLIPSHETGIRKFLFWNVNMAISTIRKIAENPCYSSADEVKISRFELLRTILLTNAVIRSDNMLRLLFDRLGKGVPYDSIEQQFFEQAAGLSGF